MSKLARVLALAAMLSAMNLAGLTAIANAHPADQPTRQATMRPPTEAQVGEYWREPRSPPHGRRPTTPPTDSRCPRSAPPPPPSRPPR
jgi:hypothetical protein